MTLKLRIIADNSDFRVADNSDADNINKDLKKGENSDPQIAESSCLSASSCEINIQTIVTKICQHFSLVIEYRNRGYQW